MWKDYSWGFIKSNRAMSASIVVAAFICSLFLSFLCAFFYNMWTYETEAIVLRDGDWHSRVEVSPDSEILPSILAFANVGEAFVNPELSNGDKTVIDIRFSDMRAVFSDTPLIASRLGIGEGAVDYNVLLLSRYLIHDPADPEPPMLLGLYIAVLVVVSISLVLIIHNSFALSMNSRVRQFGIFSSVGATPGQIRLCLFGEAAALSIAPIVIGDIIGIAVCRGSLWGMELIARGIPGRHEVVFQYGPMIFAFTLLVSALTVFVSAWMPAHKLSRLTPLEAIRSSGELSLKKRRRAGLLSKLFGIEGELASNAMKAQRRALRTSRLSLTLSFLAFSVMLCFFALSGISTRHTYFEKYQDVWDVMATFKNTDIAEFDLTDELRGLEGVNDLAVYQKALAALSVSPDQISEELAELGGPTALAGSIASDEGGFRVKAPLVILDDEAFLEYCRQIGIEPHLDGAVVLNQIWDSKNSNFRYKKYVPFIAEDGEATLLYTAASVSPARLPVTGYTSKAPELREEYDNYSLVHILPVSLWKSVRGDIATQADTYARILMTDETLSRAEILQRQIANIAGQKYIVETENRIGERISNDYMLRGYKLILASFCVLLAVIGVANVFSNTMGFISLRRREFARYFSIGMTPKGVGKLFAIEAVIVAGRPILTTIILTCAFVAFTVNASHLDPAEFLAEAPFVPIGLFCLGILFFVALAYYIGGRRLLKGDLLAALRDDALV